MTHLTDTTLNGYIHHTLTDAERESIDVHLAECTSCRSRTQEAERLQRHIHQSLTAEIRAVQPSAKMTFTAVTPALHRRRWAGFQFNALQVLSTIGTMAVIAVIATLAFYIIQQRNEQPFGSSPLGQMRDSRVFFGQEWTDPTPYQSGLIRSEQAALDLLATAPIYHMDLTLSDDLRRVNGRQDLRFTNNSSSGLTDLYFHLLPNLVNHSLTIRGVNINGEAVNWELVENGRYLRIYLPYTTAPGEQFVVSMDFVLQLVGSNRGFNGTLGNIEDVLTLAHFHPMLVAMQNGQWDLTPTVHGLGNLTDNSFYQVRVNAPEPLTILSNGLEIRRALITEESITRQNITLAAGPVNQFFLTASNQFNTVISETVGETTINSYAEADYLRRDAQTALTITASALSVYNAEFGTY
ncbi:MAG: hypothetical protein GY943_18770, partial [Chloroflexi bacterium]|nr:hypothetical protein [Chloroflexota bacterium]